ncbi:MAG: hypothetical protein U1E35_04795 [Rhodospirillales bacterium]
MTASRLPVPILLIGRWSEIQTMRRVFAFAKRRGMIAVEPQLPVMKKIKRNRRPALTNEEQEKLKVFLDSSWANTLHRQTVKAMILTLLMTGIRVSEAKSLLWGDLERLNLMGLLDLLSVSIARIC